MGNARYSQCNHACFQIKPHFPDFRLIVYLVGALIQIDCQTCSQTKKGSFIVDWGRPAHLMVQISSIWPNTGEDFGSEKQ